jgi:hypothetical protein
MALTPTVTGMTTVPKPQDPNQNQNVAKEMTGLLARDSPLMVQARTQGMQTAASRGLLSSSMAAGAASGAMIDRAMPIAAQNAAQGAAANRSYQDFTQSGDLQGQQIAAQERLAANDITARQDIQQTDIAAQKELQAADLAESAQRQATQIASDTSERGLDRGMQTRLAEMNLGAAEQSNAAGMLNAAQANYSMQFQGIMANTNMNAEQREAQIGLARRELDRRVAVTETFFAINIEWDPLVA